MTILKKAILLSAGAGTRLYPITEQIPKTMIQINGKPILQQIIEELKKSGIKDIAIVVNYLKESIMKYFGNGKKLGVKITYIEQKQLLGTADALFCARNFVKNEPFILYLADTIIPNEISEFINFVRDFDVKNALMVSKMPQEDLERSGTVEEENGKIIHIYEKSIFPKTDLAIAGIYYFNSKNLINILEKLNFGKNNEKQISDAIQQLIDQKEDVSVYISRKKFIDIGLKEGILKANYYLMTKFPKPMKVNTTIDKESSLIFPVSIGKGCRIINSQIGPFVSIGDNTIIKDSKISNSVIISNNEVISMDISNQVV